MKLKLEATRGYEDSAASDTLVSGESGGTFAPIARLAVLRDEAAEAATLANLLGRTPFVAVILALGGGVVAGTAQAGLAPLLTWCVLIAGGVVALVRAYRRAISSPFELQSLRIFSDDLSAIMLYVGFAWGAGSFLAFPSHPNFIAGVVCSAGASGIVALTLREWRTGASFSAPISVLAAAASVRSLSADGVAQAAATLALGLAPIFACYLSERLARDPAPRFAEIPPH